MRTSCPTGSTTADGQSRPAIGKALFLKQAATGRAYQNRTRLFKQGEVFPGVTAVPSLGHTPGHTAYLVASGDDQLMIWGDTVHVPEVQTAFPDAGMAFDTDLAAAAAARNGMFDRVSADGVLIAGMHLHFPAFSRLRRARRCLCRCTRGLGSHVGCAVDALTRYRASPTARRSPLSRIGIRPSPFARRSAAAPIASSSAPRDRDRWPPTQETLASGLAISPSARRGLFA